MRKKGWGDMDRIRDAMIAPELDKYVHVIHVSLECRVYHKMSQLNLQKMYVFQSPCAQQFHSSHAPTF